MLNTTSPPGHRGPQRSPLAWTVATFFGIGYLRPGSGTWAAAATICLWWVSAKFGHWTTGEFQLACAAVATLIGIPASSIVERESGTVDPGFVVIDEVAGQWIALIGLPLQWQYVLASLILFRGLDILKPPPLRQLESLPSGWGIMIDDVVAGACTAVVLQAWLHFGPWR